MNFSIVRFRASVYCILLIVSLQGTAYAQIEANNWMFGKISGLNFSNGNPETLSQSSIDAPAGCSSISDKNGDLLFYTNGQTVWNKNHAVMTGGTGLAGEIANVQSCIIIPKPNDDSVYYIFTTRQTTVSTAMASGIYYSEVHFSAADPLGIVVNKNKQINDSRTNQIAAVHAPDGETIRVVVFGTALDSDSSPRNNFFVINVTSAGVDETPIIRTQEKELVPNGVMKISPDGTLIAIAYQQEHLIYFFKFDNTAVDMEYDHAIGTDEGFTPVMPYGLEFSQDSKTVYYTGSNSQDNYLFQYYLAPSEGISAPVRIQIGNNKMGSLQMGRDGKIYVSLYKSPTQPLGYLGVVNRPDKLGLDCDYVHSGADLDGSMQKGSLLGLPNYIASIFRNRIIQGDQCVSEPFNFKLDTYAPITGVTWDFGDGTTSTSFNPSHMYTVGKEYLVKATIILKGNPITLFKYITVYPIPAISANNTMKQCDLDSDGISVFNLNNIKDFVSNHQQGFSYTFYKTQQDATDETNAIENPELYQNTTNPEEIFVTIVTQFGCTITTNFFIEASYVHLGSISTSYTCENSDDVLDNAKGRFDLSSKAAEIKTQFALPPTSVISFYANSQDALTMSNSLGLSPILASGEIWVRVDKPDLSCNGIGTMDVVVNPPIVLDIQDRYEFCGESGNIVLDGGATNDRWEWKNTTGTILGTQREFTATEVGRFTVTAYKNINGINCSLTKTFFTAATKPPAFDVVNAADERIYVSIKGNDSFEFSLDGTHFYGDGNSYTFRDIPAGVYTVYVRDTRNCGLLLTKKVALIGYPKYFSPNADGSNEMWKLQGISKLLYSQASVYIYDRYGNFLFFMNIDKNQVGWDGKYNGKSLPASDYWYTSVVIDLQDNVYTRSGHFSLVR